MREPEIHAVVMAGGSGTRFWPASRRQRPKQFLQVAGEESLIAATVARLEGLVPLERVLVVTAASQAELVREELPDLPGDNILAEPEARNTAPCVAWAAHALAERSANDEHAVQVVLPADHVIQPTEAFQATIRAAAQDALASQGLLTFGIVPTFAAEGFGWIQGGERAADVDGHAVHVAERFVEKPDRATAEGFLASGNFYWNSGMFVWSARAIAAAVEQHMPEAPPAFAKLAQGTSLADVYAELRAEPVDIAIFQKADNVRVMPVDYRWNDVGSWAALPDVLPTDGDGHVVAGGTRLVAHESKDCVVHGTAGKVIALAGVEGLVVVATDDAVLVCPKDRAQDVKAIVERLGQDAPDFL